MAVFQQEEDKESKVILTIAIVIGVVATVGLVIILGSMFFTSTSTPKKTSATSNEATDVIDPGVVTSSGPIISIKTKEGVYENSNIVRGSNGIFKSASPSGDLSEATLSERALLKKSAADIKAAGIENYTVETHDPIGVDEPGLKPDPGTITALQEFTNPVDASSIVFIYEEAPGGIDSALGVPSVVGMIEGDARTTLKQIGFKSKTIDIANVGSNIGKVIFQSPEPNRIMTSGQSVYIIVAR